MLASRSFFVFITFLVAFVAQIFAAHLARAVPAKCGAFVCPPQDNFGFVESPAFSRLVNNGQTLHCEYPSSDQKAKQFYCEYSASDGTLTSDHNIGMCPPKSAKQNCEKRRSPSSEHVYAV